MPIVFILFFLIFSALSVYFFIGKGVLFILGRNAYDENKKPKYMMRKLSGIFACITAGLALSAIIGFFGFVIKGASFLVYIAPVLFVIFLAMFLYTVINVDKYKKSNRRHRYKDDE